MHEENFERDVIGNVNVHENNDLLLHSSLDAGVNPGVAATRVFVEPGKTSPIIRKSEKFW